MRILQLCKKFPYPVKDGESLAISYLAKALHGLECELHLLAMNTTKHHSSAYEDATLEHYTSIHTVPIDNSVKPMGAFTNLFSSESYHISRFVSQAFKNQLKTLLKEYNFDIIQLETLYLAPYIPTIRKCSSAKVVMRSHNVEHEIWGRISQNTSNSLKKWYLKYLTKKLRRFELEAMQDYDFFAAITDRDLEQYKQLGYQGKGSSIPIGINVQDYKMDYPSFENISLSFIGSLDWMPNIEGLEWFLEEIFPSISKEYPNLQFYIAGRNCPDDLKEKSIPNVTVLGEVDDAHQFIQQHPVSIVPLLSGSGMRVKILEAMALGRVVITTSIGMEGIPAKDEKHLLIANTVQEYLAAIHKIITQPRKMQSISQAARAFIESEFDHTVIAEKLLGHYRDIIQENPNNHG